MIRKIARIAMAIAATAAFTGAASAESRAPLNIVPQLDAQPTAYVSYRTPQLQRKALPQQQKSTYRGAQVVEFSNLFDPGSIIIRVAYKKLYYVLGNGQAIEYGIGVGREGFTWTGNTKISRKTEWPTWTPPEEMIARQPELVKFAAGMPGGPDNPLGARALYLGSSLYRIHGTNQPWTIGGNVSSGCIRMVNEEVIDLYSRVKIGAKVYVY